MNKRAMETTEMVYWIARILFCLMMLISVFFIARIYESKVIDTAEVEAATFRNYVLYSPNGLSYTDPETGRLQPGIVDVRNFNETRLEAAADFGRPNDMVAAWFILHSASGPSVKGAFYNQQRYNDWKPLSEITTFAGIRRFFGAGTVYQEHNETYVVYVDENGNKLPGILETIILVPRT